MAIPKTLILTGYGINCDVETEYAFKKAGAKAERIHVNDLIQGLKKLGDYQVLAFPGGFSYGDDIAAGRVLANKLKTHLGDELKSFIGEDKLILGVCNGFQVMVKYGLLSLLSEGRDKQTLTLAFNDSGRFEDRWVHLKSFSSGCIFTRGIDRIDLPVAHGEGKFFADMDTIGELEHNGQVVFRYMDSSGERANLRYPFNPNGSLNDIAGVCDQSGRIFGMMPHPERFLDMTNHPRWPAWRNRRQDMPDVGDGFRIFKNAVEYFR